MIWYFSKWTSGSLPSRHGETSLSKTGAHPRWESEGVYYFPRLTASISSLIFYIFQYGGLRSHPVLVDPDQEVGSIRDYKNFCGFNCMDFPKTLNIKLFWRYFIYLQSLMLIGPKYIHLMPILISWWNSGSSISTSNQRWRCCAWTVWRL